jgi:hypothetical protein
MGQPRVPTVPSLRRVPGRPLTAKSIKPGAGRKGFLQDHAWIVWRKRAAWDPALSRARDCPGNSDTWLTPKSTTSGVRRLVSTSATSGGTKFFWNGP